MISDDLRRRLASHARRKERRVSGPFSKLPCDWRPANVLNPESGMPFTEVSAWELIAQLLEDGHAAEEMTLTDPAGARAVELKIDVGPGQPHLYVKIQIGADRVIGRSFHPSYFQKPLNKAP